ncbi:MAG TPA: DUF1003 domain-containing protein, partial [Streptosporangiaceae bacterium]|nr:DUF1003 domain-containing protein [Streptosporangiaceae bacterium]
MGGAGHEPVHRDPSSPGARPGFDPFPYQFLLFLSSQAQLLLMFVIMVGQRVIGRAADKRADQTYHNAEAVLHA